jgi:hypothetical protein
VALFGLFGGLSIWLNRSVYLKLKPVVLNLAMAAVLVRGVVAGLARGMVVVIVVVREAVVMSVPVTAQNPGAGQVHRHGALAYTAFAAAHGDHLAHPRNALARWRLAMAPGSMAGSTDRGGGRGRAGRSAFGLGQFDLHILDSGHRQQGLAGLGRDAVTLAGSETRQGQFEDGPGLLAPQPPDPAEL